MAKKLALIILDGWGIGDKSKADAIANSKTPFYDYLLKTYPHSELLTDGENVGLPEGQMGNSEVGHLNIGAGRIVYQDLAKINKAVREKTIDTNPVLLEALEYAKKNNKSLHLMGLLSPGGIHSHEQHLYKLCDLAKEHGIKNLFIHAFMDGRDCDPKSGLKHIQNLEKHLHSSPPSGEIREGAQIATVCGRYYAMDRDKRWERIKLAYDMLVNGTGKKFSSAIEAVKSSYEEKVTDEFIKPCIISEEGKIKEGDAVICFNFRTDRCREMTTVLTQKDFPEFGMKTVPLHYVTMARYDSTFKNVHVIFEKDNLSMTLGEVLSLAGKKQIRISETEKYPHVTFFFSGGHEKEFDGEKRIMIPSQKVATYDLKPEMSAEGVTEAIVTELKKPETDFVCLNFANPDMVGHTGVFSAVQKAVETVDACNKRVVEAGIENGYSFIIIADHGNAEFMINPDGSPNTAHTTNPVPCILIDTDYKKISNGKLADLAPTILKIMGIAIPKEMTGNSLV
ncbi:MAG: 2,3-bisphosphoglycerate-independent phosphoglycerate mutase [Bacteroidetes bacterium]|nr:2,3-bisphosphoglycerate-independent phosphoglycerate mutase [Bacteroidota bacterium]